MKGVPSSEGEAVLPHENSEAKRSPKRLAITHEPPPIRNRSFFPGPREDESADSMILDRCETPGPRHRLTEPNKLASRRVYWLGGEHTFPVDPEALGRHSHPG